MDPLWLAMSKFRRYRIDECIAICDELLAANPNDQAAWVLKCKATTKQSFIDDIEMDEQGVAEMLLDENALAAVSRPGTSLSAPQTASKGSSFNPAMRPVSQSGRPLTGFARPSSSSSGSATDVRAALQSSSRRGGTARPMTNLGREVRLGTASLAQSSTGALVDVEKINIKKYASKTGIAMVLADYLLYVEHNVRKALELCAEATLAADFKDWWWKTKLGKCYFKLGTVSPHYAWSVRVSSLTRVARAPARRGEAVPVVSQVPAHDQHVPRALQRVRASRPAEHCA